MKDFFYNFLIALFGEKPLHIYLACFIFAFMGSYLINGLNTINRKKTCERNPEKFNLLFLITDNMTTAGWALTLAFVIFRFSNFWIKEEINLYVYSLGLGAFFNAVVLGINILFKRVSKKITATSNKLQKI